MNRIILNETSYFGAGCRSVIAVEAARRGFKKAFFVTDKDLIKFGVAAEIIKVFDENQIPYELYSDVKANPTIANVQNGVAAYKASGADFIVALGGGSSIDTAKGIGIVVNNPDFADVKSLLEASNFVATIQNRQGFYVSCIEEIAWRQGWIPTEQLLLLGQQLEKTEYGKYLIELAKQS